MAVDSGPFPQSALDDNRNGRLTNSQRKLLRTVSRGVRRGELNVALFALAFGLVIFIAVRPGSPFLVRVFIPVGCLVLAIFLLLRALTGGDKLTQDLRHPEVKSLEGPISKEVVQYNSSGSGGGSTEHFLYVAGQRFKVGPSGYDTAPDAGFVRIYFLPISRHVVNLERLADRPFAEGTTAHEMMGQMAQAMHGHDRVQIDTVRAEMAGTTNALKATLSHDVTPPPGATDGQMLREAIVGTWSNGPVKAVFSDDGSVTISMLGSNERTAHWSIDGNGKLIADFGRHEGATEAWIVGNQLTVSLGESAITLTRSAD